MSFLVPFQQLHAHIHIHLTPWTAEEKKRKGWKGWAIVEAAETMETDGEENQDMTDDGTVRKSKRRRA